ncbi:hypothetical protein [Aquirufa salirivi]|uniref:DUF2846 domain-containing protein n=1 Tax=Aquirufa salirivi TaxID=3104729 RepID=A0ABW8RX43_9BACT
MKTTCYVAMLIGLLVVHGMRASDFPTADSSKKITVYAYHNSILKYLYFIPKKGRFKFNGELIKLPVISYTKREYSHISELQVESQAMFKKLHSTYTLKEGQVYYFKCIPISGWIKNHYKLKLVDEATGKREIQSIDEFRKEDE